MSTQESLLLVQAIQRERLAEAERHRTLLRLRREQKLRRQSHAPRRRTGIARWLHGWLTA